MLQAVRGVPAELRLPGKGSAYDVEPLLEQGRAGAIGLKIHEDWGAMPAVIEASLRAGDALDMQVQIHTDTLNESGFYEHTRAAIAGRTIHMYHSEGAGGGHAPDIIRVAGEANCLPSSTNPTNPFTVNTFDEHLDMVMVCHHLNPRVPEDVAFAESRIRRETIAAEDVLHDLGAISALGSDSQGMGRIGESIARTWQLASKMKVQRGSLPEDAGTGHDNHRIKRYVAKLTINPARIYGIDHEVGSLEVGKLADIVLWEPKFFGIKPEVVFKGGFPAWSVMGESNASLMTCEPLTYRPQWGAYGNACQRPRRDVHGARRDRRRTSPAAGPAPAARRDARHARADEGRHAAQRRAAGDRRSTPRPTASRRTASRARASPPTASPLGRRYVLK